MRKVMLRPARRERTRDPEKAEGGGEEGVLEAGVEEAEEMRIM